jgi:hypothetical protein
MDNVVGDVPAFVNSMSQQLDTLQSANTPA